MPLRRVQWITRKLVRDNPDTLFVFGDNMLRVGKGHNAGQAREMRGEPNAVGIVTKWRPSMEEDAFFIDDHLSLVRESIEGTFQRLADHLERGSEVVWPEGGIGSGRAQLSTRAPAIAALIEHHYQRLLTISGGLK